MSPSGTSVFSVLSSSALSVRSAVGLRGLLCSWGPTAGRPVALFLVGRGCKGERCRWRRARPPAPLGAACSEGARGGLKHHHLERFVLRLEGNESGNKCNERARGRLRVERLERLLLCVGVTPVARVSFPRRDRALLEPGNVASSFCPSREVTQLGTSLFRVLPCAVGGAARPPWWQLSTWPRACSELALASATGGPGCALWAAALALPVGPFFCSCVHTGALGCSAQRGVQATRPVLAHVAWSRHPLCAVWAPPEVSRVRGSMVLQQSWVSASARGSISRAREDRGV